MVSLRLKSLLFVFVISYVACSWFMPEITNQLVVNGTTGGQPVLIDTPSETEGDNQVNPDQPVKPEPETELCNKHKPECCDRGKLVGKRLGLSDPEFIKGVAEDCLRQFECTQPITGYC